MKDIVIFGAGGFGREVLWLINEINLRTPEWNIIGFVDDNEEMQGKLVHGIPVIGNSDFLLNYDKKIYLACCIGSSCTRKKIINKLSVNQNILFPNLISPDARLSSCITCGRGCIICASSILTVDIKIGNYVIVNLDCTIGHDAVLHDYVTLYPSVNVSGCVTIGKSSEIGTGANIIQGILIGENTFIGAGAVVVKDIPCKCTAVGCPAKPIKYF